MTHDHKAALNIKNECALEWTYSNHAIQESIKMFPKTWDAIRSALQLAQEVEQLHEKLADERMENIKQFAIIQQLRKERDDWQLKYNALLRVFGTVSDELESKVNENGNA